MACSETFNTPFAHSFHFQIIIVSYKSIMMQRKAISFLVSSGYLLVSVSFQLFFNLRFSLVSILAQNFLVKCLVAMDFFLSLMSSFTIPSNKYMPLILRQHDNLGNWSLMLYHFYCTKELASLFVLHCNIHISQSSVLCSQYNYISQSKNEINVFTTVGFCSNYVLFMHGYYFFQKVALFAQCILKPESPHHVDYNILQLITHYHIQIYESYLLCQR